MAAASSSISAAPGLPLLSLDPQCPVLVIVDTRKPINQGFGARVTFIAWAADVARKLGAQLAIDEHFWASGHMKQYHYGHSFPWAWDLFPFLKAGDAIKALPRPLPGIKDKSVTVDTLLRTWECGRVYRLQVGTKFSCGERVPWCYDRLVGAFSRTLEFVSSERAATPKLAAMRRVRNATEPVLAVWHIRTGDIKLAMRRQAAEAMKKTIDGSFPRRGVEHVVLTYKRADITSAFPWFAEIGLREIRDSTTLGDEQSFELMLNAGVVVSTGSSFPHAPAGLALPGHQVHLYMAPKTVVKDPKTPHDTRCCLTIPFGMPDECVCEPIEFVPQQPSSHHAGRLAAKARRNNASSTTTSPNVAVGAACPDESVLKALERNRTRAQAEKAASTFNYRMRTHPWWMGSFIRRNTVPINCAGQPFPEYRQKLRRLAEGIDSEEGRASEAVAQLAYEGWL